MLASPEARSFGVSVGYILLTAGLLKLSRLILSKLNVSTYNKTLVLEFLATFELIATVFELGIVLQKHGFLPFACLLMIMFNYWGTTWQLASPAPHPRIIEVILRKTSWQIGLAKIFSQFLAALLVYTFYVKPIWTLGYRGTHIQRINATRCFTNLKVPIATGILAEAISTGVFVVAAKLCGPRKYNWVTLPLVLVSLKFIGLTYTGAFMNPMLASTIQFGCEGIEWTDHFLVYWVGPVVGALTANFVISTFSPVVKVKSDKKTK